jgi:hypothetical protein
MGGSGGELPWNISMPVSNWTHIVVTRTNGATFDCLLFTNGVYASTVNYGFATTPQQSSRIARISSNSGGYGGMIDEFFLVKRGFTAADCQVHMSNTPPVLNLPGCYPGGNIRVRGTP